MFLEFIIGKLDGKVDLTYHKTGVKFTPRRSTISESIVLKRWSSFVPFRFTHFLELTLLLGLENNSGADSKRPFNI